MWATLFNLSELQVPHPLKPWLWKERKYARCLAYIEWFASWMWFLWPGLCQIWNRCWHLSLRRNQKIWPPFTCVSGCLLELCACGVLFGWDHCSQLAIPCLLIHLCCLADLVGIYYFAHKWRFWLGSMQHWLWHLAYITMLSQCFPFSLLGHWWCSENPGLIQMISALN